MTIEAVRRTLAVYPKIVDSRDAEGYAALFTPQGRVQTRFGVFVGREAIEGFFRQLYEEQPPDRIFKHMYGNFILTPEGDTIKVEADMVVFECLKESAWQPYTVVRHHDRLEKQPNGEWLFSEAAMEEIVYLRTKWTPAYEV